jgi:predicted DNA-binding transcriptional regulator AlpA
MDTNAQNAQVRRLIDCEQVAEMLGLKPSWVRDRCRPSTPEADRIPGMVRLGRYVKFQLHAVEEWINNGCKPAEQRVKSIAPRKAAM